MKNKKSGDVKQDYHTGVVIYTGVFPRPICLEKCTLNIKKEYEKDIIKTLKAFSNEAEYYSRTPHKLKGRETRSIDVNKRGKYRMLYFIENGICKITDLCTEETHKKGK